ncbi:MAG TPA: hypothetical protein VF590_08985, partial [Isosphaeraceae bacterium]
PIPWRAWLGQGVGFLILLLVHIVGMDALAGLQRWSLRGAVGPGGDEARLRRRFAAYRAAVRLATLGATAALAVWLGRSGGG